jgi:DNA polymerase-3 subunit alpha
LFGAVSLAPEVKAPAIAPCEKWLISDELEHEREVVGIYLSAHPLDPFKFEMENLGFTPIANVLEPVKGPPFKIAGFLSDIGHLYTRKGTQFGKATINDFSGHLEFALFGDNYVKWNKFLLAGQKVVLTACYQEKPWNAAEIELSIQGISLLENARDASVKAFNVELELVKLNEETARFLMENCEQHPGNADLVLHVVQPNSPQVLKMKTGARKIAVSDSLLQFLDEQNIRYGVELARG